MYEIEYIDADSRQSQQVNCHHNQSIHIKSKNNKQNLSLRVDIENGTIIQVVVKEDIEVIVDSAYKNNKLQSVVLYPSKHL